MILMISCHFKNIILVDLLVSVHVCFCSLSGYVINDDAATMLGRILPSLPHLKFIG